ncbi:MAG: nucleotidyltransferase family protein [Actinomycetota bacterium]|nr:nucleotidyltransferase family protein [Actinomycetota bacterium]
MDVLLTVHTLLVDQVTAEVIAALRGRQVASILLKGPSIAAWLYADGTLRSYNDCDLLVAPEGLLAAQAVLDELGFRDTMIPLDHPRLESHEWVRGRDRIDLHTTLIGIGALPRVVWGALSAMTLTQQVAGVEVQVLGPTALALHVVLHAAQHGREDPKPVEDLSRAIRAVPRDRWREVAALADRLQATDAFGVGLRLLPEGRALASWLELPPPRSADAFLRVDRVPLALAFEHLATTAGARARASLVLRELFPTPAFIRWWSPLARRGPLGLAIAYCWRPVWLITQAGPGFLAWRRARREGADRMAAPS